ncbi:hypothetical protein IWX49DRAFT_32636 [Phyllosticta citricarpa]|uniref:Uncharacterized protein n=2 Tax=Phyllosticta TaxID=121621 RepID=A0ABR1MHB1_9PEZI
MLSTRPSTCLSTYLHRACSDATQRNQQRETDREQKRPAEPRQYVARRPTSVDRWIQAGASTALDPFSFPAPPASMHACCFDDAIFRSHPATCLSIYPVNSARSCRFRRSPTIKRTFRTQHTPPVNLILAVTTTTLRSARSGSTCLANEHRASGFGHRAAASIHPTTLWDEGRKQRWKDGWVQERLGWTQPHWPMRRQIPWVGR